MPVTSDHLRTAVELAQQFGAQKVILFGSALTDPEEAQDLDLACDVPGLALFAYAGRLEEALGIPVDVLPLHPRNAFVQHIEEYGTVLYEAI